MLIVIWAYANSCEIMHVKTAFKRGYTNLPTNPDCFVERPDVLGTLVPNIKPQYTDVYFFVEGLYTQKWKHISFGQCN